MLLITVVVLERMGQFSWHGPVLNPSSECIERVCGLSSLATGAMQQPRNFEHAVKACDFGDDLLHLVVVVSCALDWNKLIVL